MADGGRELGDVELALFRKQSVKSGSPPRDPLSLLAADDAYAPPDAPAPPSRPYPASLRSRSDLPHPSPPLRAAHAARDPPPRSPVTAAPPMPPAGLPPPAAASAPGLVPEASWRDAMVTVCADLLGKSLGELQAEFDAAGGKGTGPHAPRDLADYSIMTTLRTRDAFAMQNAPSWLFNTMDRSGAGYVLREEFVRYAPFMAPVADAAVAAAIFDELVRAQVAEQARVDAEAAKVASGAAPPRPQRFQRTRERTTLLAAGAASTAKQCSEGVRPSSGLRKRQAAPVVGAGAGGDPKSGVHRGELSPGGAGSDPSVDDAAPQASSRDLYPISAALRFATWKQYFDAIQKKYHYKDDEWARVKAELGLDPTERLIKAQGALDHSLALPTLGKLFLSQRYLVFFAAVGRNHYVARLGAVAEVGARSLPLLMRDCLTVRLESETHAAMNGISANAASLATPAPNAAPRDQLGGASMNRAAGGADRGVAGRAPAAGIGDQRRTRRSLPRPAGGDSGGGAEGGGGGGGTHEIGTGGDRTGVLSVLAEGDVAAPTRAELPSSDRSCGDRGDAGSGRGGGARGGGLCSSAAAPERERAVGGWGGREKSMAQHVAEVMRQFTAGGKPLVFSLLEFRDTSRRDLWMAVIKELAAAHRLHLQLGFGSSGRVVPERHAGSDPCDSPGGGASFDDASCGDSGYMVYLTSPFRNEPPPPLLAVAAHSNLVRYRALRVIDGARNPVSLLVFSHAERCKTALSWYVDSVRAHDDRGGRSWIERAMDAIRENMELNKRVYVVKDDEPFDVARLGEGIGRLAELCTPVVRVAQFVTHIVQWRNPPATVLSLFLCLYVVYARLVVYLPGVLLFATAGVIVATRTRGFGLDSWLWGGGRPEDARERQANVLELVSQVHDTLRAGQNVIKRLNVTLGKAQTLCLWGSGEEWQSWAIVCVLCLIGLLLLLADARVLFTVAVWMVFSKHFLPPRNIVRRFWSSVPARVVGSSDA